MNIINNQASRMTLVVLISAIMIACSGERNSSYSSEDFISSSQSANGEESLEDTQALSLQGQGEEGLVATDFELSPSGDAYMQSVLAANSDLNGQLGICRIDYPKDMFSLQTFYPGSRKTCLHFFSFIKALGSFSQTRVHRYILQDQAEVIDSGELGYESVLKFGATCNKTQDISPVPAYMDAPVNLSSPNASQALADCRRYCQLKKTATRNKIARFSSKARCELRTFEYVGFTSSKNDITRTISY